jgi:hypothetical protein
MIAGFIDNKGTPVVRTLATNYVTARKNTARMKDHPKLKPCLITNPYTKMEQWEMWSTVPMSAKERTTTGVRIDDNGRDEDGQTLNVIFTKSPVYLLFNFQLLCLRKGYGDFFSFPSSLS